MNLDAFITAASDYADRVDHLFWLLTIISGLIVALVVVLLVTFLFVYQRGSRANRADLPERAKHEIEIGWTVATAFLFLFIFWWAASNQLAALSPPNDALEIHVVGKQWMWRIQHPSGAREINEIHAPVETPVRLAMISEDVIHDLYLPALRLKQDVLPGRYTYLWFTANKTGIFHLTCAEFCGTDHSVMAGRLAVVSPQDYARWTAAQPEGDDLAHQGEAFDVPEVFQIELDVLPEGTSRPTLEIVHLNQYPQFAMFFDQALNLRHEMFVVLFGEFAGEFDHQNLPARIRLQID